MEQASRDTGGGETVDRIRFERQLWNEGLERVMGLGEVGRGCLAGPVVAAGVIFEAGGFDETIRGSQVLSLGDRRRLSRTTTAAADFWTGPWCRPAAIDWVGI